MGGSRVLVYMPRPPRLHEPGILAHVIARGNRRQAIFEDEDDWQRLSTAIRSAAVCGAFDLCAYCLMPNHLHLLLRCTAAPIGKELHRILTSHALYMNKKYDRTGHLFQGRYQSHPCRDDGHAKGLIRYIHENPVRGRLVKTVDEWPWSSHLDYLGTRPGGVLPVEFGLALFGPEPSRARLAYAAFMQLSPPPPVAEASGRPSLAALAARAERDGGHRPGFLRGGRRNLTAAALRRRFILDALASGHRGCDVASFLGMAESVVNWARRTAP